MSPAPVISEPSVRVTVSDAGCIVRDDGTYSSCFPILKQTSSGIKCTFDDDVYTASALTPLQHDKELLDSGERVKITTLNREWRLHASLFNARIRGSYLYNSVTTAMHASKLGRRAIPDPRYWVKSLVSEQPCVPHDFERTIDGCIECRFAGDDNTYTASPFPVGSKYSKWIADGTQNVQVTRKCYVVEAVSSPLPALSPSPSPYSSPDPSPSPSPPPHISLRPSPPAPPPPAYPPSPSSRQRLNDFWRTVVPRSVSSRLLPPTPAPSPAPAPPPFKPHLPLTPLALPPSSATATVYRMTTAVNSIWVHWEEIYITDSYQTQTRSGLLCAKFVDGSWYTTRTLLANEELYKSVMTAIMAADAIEGTYEAKLRYILLADRSPNEVWHSTHIEEEEYRRNAEIRQLLLSDLAKTRYGAHAKAHFGRTGEKSARCISNRMNARESSATGVDVKFMPWRMALQDTFWSEIRNKHP
ncbi:hypothetical protein C8R47DRAFT_1196431 [Mycena vitilis]|nr:hypothetical protein C8R47DRAFT_1196431 [Mycena vitilis]